MEKGNVRLEREELQGLPTTRLLFGIPAETGAFFFHSLQFLIWALGSNF